MRKGELTPRHRKFAELIVRGETAQAAYALCYPHCCERTANVGGARLKNLPAIAAFIANLQKQLAEELRSEQVITLQEALEFLTEVVRTPAGRVDKYHQLCQSSKSTPHTREVTMPCKLRAAELAMKLQGLLTEKVQHEAGDTLLDFLVELRAGGTSSPPIEQKELNPDHQKFAELIVQDQPANAAYLACFPGRKKSSAKSEGSRLQHKPDVAAFIRKRRAEQAEKFRAETILTLKEALEFLTAVIRTPAGLVDEGHPLCQKFSLTNRMRKVTLPCKLRALELAMKLQGLLTDKVQHEAGDTLQDFLAELRVRDAE